MFALHITAFKLIRLKLSKTIQQHVQLFTFVLYFPLYALNRKIFRVLFSLYQSQQLTDFRYMYNHL